MSGIDFFRYLFTLTGLNSFIFSPISVFIKVFQLQFLRPLPWASGFSSLTVFIFSCTAVTPNSSFTLLPLEFLCKLHKVNMSLFTINVSTQLSGWIWCCSASVEAEKVGKTKAYKSVDTIRCLILLLLRIKSNQAPSRWKHLNMLISIFVGIRKYQ